jgi:hypothetical protein
MFNKSELINEIIGLDIIKKLKDEYPDQDIEFVVRSTVEALISPPQPSIPLDDGDDTKEVKETSKETESPHPTV